MPHEVVSVEWGGRSVDAFVPAPLAEIGELSVAARLVTARTEGALEATPVHKDPRLEMAGRLLLRAEGVASSRIEAINASLDAVAVAVAVADVDASVTGPAGEVVDNLRALDAVMTHEGPLSRSDLWRWHRILMASADLDIEHKGVWRDRLGWIGGPTPHRAAHVATPEDRIDDLMGDLVEYANSPAHDPVAASGLLHAQFETIHPFADGNGRLGRLLIGWMLRRHLGLTVPPPVSVAFLRDVGGYLAGLTLYRTVGPDQWIRWFATTVGQAATSGAGTLGAVSGLVASWPARLADLRADAAALRLVDQVISYPALDVALAVDLLGVSRPTARAALEALAERGVLRRADVPGTGGPGRPRRWWVAGELLDLLSR